MSEIVYWTCAGCGEPCTDYVLPYTKFPDKPGKYCTGCEPF